MFYRKSLRHALSATAIALMLASPVSGAFAGQVGSVNRIVNDIIQGDGAHFTSSSLPDYQTPTAPYSMSAPELPPRPSASGITAGDVAGAVIAAVLLGALFGGSSSGESSYGGGDDGLSHGDADRLMRYNNRMSGNCGGGMC